MTANADRSIDSGCERREKIRTRMALAQATLTCQGSPAAAKSSVSSVAEESYQEGRGGETRLDSACSVDKASKMTAMVRCTAPWPCRITS